MMQADSTYQLFIQSLNITNAAMEANRDSIFLKPLLTACDAELRDEDFGVAIFEDDPEHPVDNFTIRLENDTFVLVSHQAPRGDAESVWKVSKSYLQDVVEHPRKYIDNPALLAFDWLKQRVNLSV